MVPDNLYAKPGEKILPKLNDLVGWAKRQRIIPGGENVYVSETASGTIVTYEDRPVILSHPFQILLADDRSFYLAQNSYVNGVPPVFYDQTAGQYLRTDLYLRQDNPARIGEYSREEEVYFMIVVRWLGSGQAPLTSGSFTVFHASVEALTQPQMLAQGAALQDVAMGIPYKNTGKANAAVCTAEFYIPIAFLRYGVVHAFVRHNLNYRIYYDTERKRMAYFAA